jgi:hypothetical protein
MDVIQHCFICRVSDSTVSEDAGIEPRTIANLALKARHSNQPLRCVLDRYSSERNLFDFLFSDVLCNCSRLDWCRDQVSAKDKKCIQVSHPLTVLSGNYIPGT